MSDNSTQDSHDQTHKVPPRLRRSKGNLIERLLVATVAAGVVTGAVSIVGTGTPGGAQSVSPSDLNAYRSLDGSNNNTAHSDWGAANTIYPRVAPANYADGIGEPVEHVNERYVSNRIYNDSHQNIFSKNGLSHWEYIWGQFIDHTIGFREQGDEDISIAFDQGDPLEEFQNDPGVISATRSAVAPGSGETTPREQLNTVSSYIDGWAVYGGTDERLDWLREGSLDGDPTNNSATLLNREGYLPKASSRPNTDAPSMDFMGRLMGSPTDAIIAGDVRANENIGLTAVQTLFMREHNRIVALLPDTLDEQSKFELARRVVAATQQYITYNEFLPTVGVELSKYDGYDPNIDASVSNEFATVGYRAHSQIHGEFEAEVEAGELSEDVMASLSAHGIELAPEDGGFGVTIPLAVAFGNPDLVEMVGLGNVLAGLASERAYANDEQIDNQLRSVLFQVPGPDVQDPMSCLDGTALSGCYSVVNDLGALDAMRGYDHGMPSYNDMRVAFGLPPVTSFTQITGEASEEFPTDPEIDPAGAINDPSILDFVKLSDSSNSEIDPQSPEASTEVESAIRRTSLASRLKATFGSVDKLDAFTGMISEAHLPGREFGELQLAMWGKQFEALRDGDRFFYGNDPVLEQINQAYGIDFRRTLAEVIVDNTEVEPQDIPYNVFLAGSPSGSDSGAHQDHSSDATGDSPARSGPDGANVPRQPRNGSAPAPIADAASERRSAPNQSRVVTPAGDDEPPQTADGAQSPTPAPQAPNPQVPNPARPLDPPANAPLPPPDQQARPDRTRPQRPPRN